MELVFFVEELCSQPVLRNEYSGQKIRSRVVVAVVVVVAEGFLLFFSYLFLGSEMSPSVTMRESRARGLTEILMMFFVTRFSFC